MNTPNIPYCCDIENEIFKKNDKKSNGKRYTCQAKNDTNQSPKRAFQCPDKFKYNKLEILGKEKVQNKLENMIGEDTAANDVCIGVLAHDAILEISMLACEPICNNNTPCFRFCCGKG